VIEKSLASSSIVRPSTEEVPQVLEQTIHETPRHVDNVIAEEEEEESEKEMELVSLGDDTDATDRRACRLPYHLLCQLYDARGKKRKQPVFSPKSSETEFSTDSGSSLSICSPWLSKATTSCASSANPMMHEVVLIHLSSDLEGDVDIARLVIVNILFSNFRHLVSLFLTDKF